MAKKSSANKTDWAALLNSDGLADGVTAENYYHKCRAYANHHARHPADIGHSINPIDQPDLYGAWFIYLKTKKCSLNEIKRIGEESTRRSKEFRQGWGYQVPASLPSDFDAEWSAALDLEAGNRFMSAQQRKRDDVAKMDLSTEERQAHVKKSLKGRRFGTGFNKTSCHDLAAQMVKHNISVPGTQFNAFGCVFPDGTRYNLDEMQNMVDGIGDR